MYLYLKILSYLLYMTNKNRNEINTKENSKLKFNNIEPDIDVFIHSIQH